MTAEQRIKKAVEQLDELLYYFPYQSTNVVLRNKIKNIYNTLKDQQNGKDFNRFIHSPQRQED